MQHRGLILAGVGIIIGALVILLAGCVPQTQIVYSTATLQPIPTKPTVAIVMSSPTPTSMTTI